MKNENKDIRVRDCMQCESMREMIMIKKNKFEVYCDEDGEMKGKVKSIFDSLIPDYCPLRAKEKQQSFTDKIFHFLKM